MRLLHVAPLEYVVTATASQYRTVELPDGSSVLPGPYSQIRYAEKLNEVNPRVVEMRGQVVFTVAHNPGKPFVALTKLARVTAVGTKLRAAAWKVIRLWEHEVEADANECVRQIERLLLRAPYGRRRRNARKGTNRPRALRPRATPK